MKPLCMKFNKEGLIESIVLSYNKKGKNFHLIIENNNNIPKNFKSNPDYYHIKIEYGEIAGIKLREDLEEYKKQQELIKNSEIW